MTITKLNIKNRFLMVCIEKHRASIPPAIDRVPAILTHDRELVLDEDITSFVHGLVQSDKDTVDKTGGQKKASSSHQTPKELSSAGGAGFSYLGGEGGAGSAGGGEFSSFDEDISGTSSFGIFGQDQRIETPNDDDNDEDSSFDYERFKASRDADITSSAAAAP